MLKADLERQGMNIELQANSKEIIGKDDVEAIKLADGRIIETDLVVMAVGIRPFTQVARDAGLEVNRVSLLMIIYKHQTLIFMRLANVQSMTAKYMA